MLRSFIPYELESGRGTALFHFIRELGR
jgi:hypothetical protein